MTQVFVTHPTSKLSHYFGDKAFHALQALPGVQQVHTNPHDRELELAELASLARDCRYVISYRQTAADAALFAALPQLAAFLRCAIDIRNIDVAAAGRHGVLVTQASAGFITSVCEWTLGAMIDLSRGIGAATASYHAGTAPPPRMGRELRGATLGVIGYGQISRELCRLALAFGLRVVVNDPYAQVDRADITACDLPELLGQSDYVVCLAVATPETENLMNATRFAAMRRGAFFINPSRGNLVDEQALLAALDSGHLAGCALDVGRAPDQMPTPAVARHPRVVATPHIGGLTPPAIEHQALETVAQIDALLQRRMPAGAVNPSEATRLAALWRLPHTA